MIFEIDGHKCKRPATCRDVLQWSVDICLRILDADNVDACDILNAATWVARHTIGKSAGDLMDELTADEIFELGNAIVASAELPPSAVTGARRIWDLATKATDYDATLADDLPCECLACRGIEANDERCLYANVTPSAQTLASLRMIAEEPALLDAPWWVFQLRKNAEASKALGMASVRQRAAKHKRDVETAREIVGRVWPMR